jgi:hypothetical protein
MLGEGWEDDFVCYFKSFTVTSFVSLRNDAVVGFVTYVSTSRGYFSQTGVLESERGKAIGKELLVRSLVGLREPGYACAIIGAAGPTDFNGKKVGGRSRFPAPPGSLPCMENQRVTLFYLS